MYNTRTHIDPLPRRDLPSLFLQLQRTLQLDLRQIAVPEAILIHQS